MKMVAEQLLRLPHLQRLSNLLLRINLATFSRRQKKAAVSTFVSTAHELGYLLLGLLALT